ncbi:RNA 2',3'-cyclic phosphodiesterase [Acidisphaera sp. L21]|uniref:RNA 2',3'-cyclic phosphodiesterase n=1 Tax=Acidisphaera sp. L21 TaxID=1641851 RepID=UPI00131D4B7F|nr:RNA 2',3'-cyclic phosphodiesterase [Acidisphaera sp. L21]
MRLFVALELPHDARARLARLGTSMLGARWLPPENLHLTLRFLGEMPGHRAEELDGALAALRGRGFTLHISGVGVLEKAGRPQALWAGIERNPQLDHLQAKIETAVQRVGFEPERRRFNPHVTVARLDNASPLKLAEWVQANNLLRADPVDVEHFTLFSSRLGKDGAVYTAEVEYGLA